MPSLMVVSLGILVCFGLIVSRLAVKRHKARTTGQALLRATEIGDVEQMHMLLANGADVNSTNAQGWTPLHVAAAGGDLAVVETLLHYGADVNAVSYIGSTPLYNAMVFGRKQVVVEVLLAHGANPDSAWDAAF
jgi:ankyrin repeat protein